MIGHLNLIFNVVKRNLGAVVALQLLRASSSTLDAILVVN